MVEEQRRFVYSDYGTSGSSIDIIKLKNRSISEDIRKERKQNLLHTKRFRSEKATIGNDNSADSYSEEKVQRVAKLFQKKNNATHAHLKYLRNAFAQSSDFIQVFIDVENTMFALVGYLTGGDTTLQLEAAWCITNITANNYQNMMTIVKATSAYLITFLKGSSILLQDQSAWALGNMAAESDEIRAMLKVQGIIEPLIQLVVGNVDGVVQSALFAICNLCRSQEMFVPDLICSSPLPKVIFKKLCDCDTDVNIIGEIAWLLTHFTYHSNYFEYLVDNGVLKYAKEWICKVRPHHQDFLFVATPLLRCLGNLLSANNPDFILKLFSEENKLFLHTLNSLLAANKRHLIKECLWLLSNVFATDLTILDAFSNELLLIISSVTRHLSSAYEIKKEAAVCVCNLVSQNNVKYVLPCSSKPVMTSIVEMFKLPDNDLVWLTLRYLDVLLSRDEVDNTFENFLQCDGPSYLEALQFHENVNIRNKAIDLLETHYEQDDTDVEPIQEMATSVIS